MYDLMKEVCLHDISIHFHINRSINECARLILALRWSNMTLDDLKGHTSFYQKFVLKSFEKIGR